MLVRLGGVGGLAGCLIAVACSKQPSPPPASWEPDRSCAASSDCTPAPACCPAPCSSDVINKKDVGQAQARVDAQCTKEMRASCPQAGSCRSHAYTCLRGKCALIFEGSADWPADAQAR
jgi:hypothetical protein